MHSLKRITLFVKCGSFVLCERSRDKGIWVSFWWRWFYPTCYSDGKETHKQSKTCYFISFHNLFFLSLHIYFLLYLVYCCTQAFSSCGEQRLLFAAVLELLIVMFLMWRSTGSRHSGFSSCSTWALEFGFSYSVA